MVATEDNERKPMGPENGGNYHILGAIIRGIEMKNLKRVSDYLDSLKNADRIKALLALSLEPGVEHPGPVDQESGLRLGDVLARREVAAIHE